MATYYAWSPVHTSKDGKAVVIPIGDPVTEADVGKADFEYLIEQRAIRTTKYPDDIQGNESPTEYFKRKIAEAAEGGDYAPVQEEDKSTPVVNR